MRSSPGARSWFGFGPARRPARGLALARAIALALALAPALAACARQARGPTQPAAPAAAPAPGAAGPEAERSADMAETATQGAHLSPHHGQHGGLDHLSLPHRLIDGHDGHVLDPEAAFAELAQARVVYVSERHDNPHDHAVQLGIIAAMYARDHSLAIGMEMFKHPFQPALDDYIAGKIDEPTMLARTEWDDRWGFDFELYRPVLEFARAHKIRVVALNAPDEITRTVADGGLAALSANERAALPDLDLTNQEHRSMLKEVFEAHHGRANTSFEDFYAAQVIWDETMAFEIARALKAAQAPKHMVVLAGDGHIRYGFGIPDRAARRGAAPFKIVLPTMLRDLRETVEDAAGDVLWVMAMSEADLPDR